MRPPRAVQAIPAFRDHHVPIDTTAPDGGVAGRRSSTTGSGTARRRSRRPAPIRPPARAAPPSATRGSTARGSTRCRSTCPSSRSASTPGRWADRRRRQRQQGHVHVPGHDVVRRHRRAAGALRHGGHDPGRDGHLAARVAGRGQGRQRRRRQGRGASTASTRSSRRSAARVTNADGPQPAGHRRPGRHAPDRAASRTPPAPADLGITPAAYPASRATRT